MGRDERHVDALDLDHARDEEGVPAAQGAWPFLAVPQGEATGDHELTGCENLRKTRDRCRPHEAFGGPGRNCCGLLHDENVGVAQCDLLPKFSHSVGALYCLQRLDVVGHESNGFASGLTGVPLQTHAQRGGEQQCHGAGQKPQSAEAGGDDQRESAWNQEHRVRQIAGPLEPRRVELDHVLGDHEQDNARDEGEHDESGQPRPAQGMSVQEVGRVRPDDS
jgi:hypothetical protein